VIALVTASVVLIDLYSAPAPAAADAGKSLTAPIPPTPADQRAGSIRNQIGWTVAKKRLGIDMPMGRGIPVGQVESSFQGGYIANTNDKGLPGTGFIPESGQSKASGHATQVAKNIAGPDAAGQGVRAVHAWTVSDWMGPGFLRTTTEDAPKDDHPARVFNHSWIGGAAPTAPLILRRVDYLVDAHDVLVVCGVNNEPGQIPALLASAYNVISVGIASGQNSDALTEIEGKGRCKPELVAPGNKTSWTTGVVTGVVAALLESADRLVEAGDEKDEDAAPGAEGEAKPEEKPNRNKDAARSEVIKALLLAGADRPERWSPPEGEPLDRKFGAGIVDLDRALVMLDAGHVAPDAPTSQRYGWSFATIEPKQVRHYDFTVDTEQGQAGFALTWHRKVLGGKARLKNAETGEERIIWNSAQFTPNLDMGLIRVNADGSETLVASSTSEVDNVELIHLTTLEPGNYTLRVTRKHDDTKQPWDYAIAWRIEAKTE